MAARVFIAVLPLFHMILWCRYAHHVVSINVSPDAGLGG
jgi:hypothetical protein